MIERRPFGRTRAIRAPPTIFGAAALAAPPGRGRPALGDPCSATGDHIDTAARYGDSELRIGPWIGAAPGGLLPGHQDRLARGARRALRISSARWSGSAWIMSILIRSTPWAIPTTGTR